MKENNCKSNGFQKLWAPWRMKYIDGIDDGSDETCIFCEKQKQHKDEKNFIIYRGTTCYIILNIYPYNNGHLMVVPYKHTSGLSDLDSKTRLEMIDTADKIMTAMKNVMRPDGFNLGINFGRTAGAGIEDHLHIHIVPRWNGDTNFMPVIGSTKVISESLEECYSRLKGAIESIME